MVKLLTFSTMPSSDLLDLPRDLGIVCHDAGAANHIFAWLEDESIHQYLEEHNWHLLAQGPAAKLWNKYDLPEIKLCQSIDEVLKTAQTLLVGTGWASDLEYEAIKNARGRGIFVIAVIDHWVNYRSRFIREGVEVLPDEIWVTDGYAERIATSEFNGINIVQKPNLYLDKLVTDIRSYGHVESDETNLLYLLEPIREAWGAGVTDGEFEALDYFVDNLNSIGLAKNTIICLRPHPSDPAGKYLEWINRHLGLNIKLDENRSLAEAIARSDVVIGCQTYAMVVALAAGKQVFSSVPPWASSCVLPQQGIIKISELIQDEVSKNE